MWSRYIVGTRAIRSYIFLVVSHKNAKPKMLRRTSRCLNMRPFPCAEPVLSPFSRLDDVVLMLKEKT